MVISFCLGSFSCSFTVALSLHFINDTAVAFKADNLFRFFCSVNGRLLTVFFIRLNMSAAERSMWWIVFVLMPL